MLYQFAHLLNFVSVHQDLEVAALLELRKLLYPFGIRSYSNNEGQRLLIEGEIPYIFYSLVDSHKEVGTQMPLHPFLEHHGVCLFQLVRKPDIN